MNSAEKEYRRLMRWAPPAIAALWGFLIRDTQGQSALVSLEHDLVHGTPTDGLREMLANGFEPQPHSIIGGSWLCVSPNLEMLKFFGETKSRYNGFVAHDCPLENLLKLQQIHTSFLQIIAGEYGNTQIAEQIWQQEREDPRNVKIIRWMIRNELLDFEGNVAPIFSSGIGDDIWKHFPPHIHGLMWPGCHSNFMSGQWLHDSEDNEAEISLTSSGAKIFEKHATTVYLEGDELSREYASRLLLACA